MTNEKPSFVFFGSGPVAAASLRRLHTEFTCEAVVTKTTTLQEMTEAANSCEVLTVTDKSSLDALFATKKFNSSVAILIDFGIIVSNKIIAAFEHGIVNSHFSLLPELRGADPISFAILEGKKQTGVSLMLLVAAMDEGPIIDQKAIPIEEDDTTATLTTKLINLSTQMLHTSLPLYLDGTIAPTKQDTATISPTYARKLKKTDGLIDWTKPAVLLEREIRAFSGWPKSYTTIYGLPIIVHKARVNSENDSTTLPGSINITPDRKALRIACGQGSLWLEIVQPAGKKPMPIDSFLAGYGSRFERD